MPRLEGITADCGYCTNGELQPAERHCFLSIPEVDQIDNLKKNDGSTS